MPLLPVTQPCFNYCGKVIGICSGFQMLGKRIADPHGVEGKPGSCDGLGLLDIETELTQDKRLVQVRGTCAFADAKVTGYEIHMGVSHGPALEQSSFMIDGRPEGARSLDDQVLGTYLHGVFDHQEACNALLRWAGLHTDTAPDLGTLREESLNRMADATTPLLDALNSIAQKGSFPLGRRMDDGINAGNAG